MSKFSSPFIALLTCSFLLSGQARSDTCPPFEIGITSENKEDGWHFHSSVAVKNVLQDLEFEKDAQFEGEIRAKLALKNDKRVPKAKNNVLYGVTGTSFCRAGDTIYVSVSISDKSARAAVQMKNLMLDSLRELPSRCSLVEPQGR